MKKITIECSENEAHLIERALELYGRVGLLQFEYLDLCGSLQKLIWDKNLGREFDDQARDLKALFGYTRNSNPGIFNTEHVSDDARIAFHIYQQLRHQRYLDRLSSGEQTEKHHTVDEYPADTCSMAGIPSPNFKIEIKC